MKFQKNSPHNIVFQFCFTEISQHKPLHTLFFHNFYPLNPLCILHLFKKCFKKTFMSKKTRTYPLKNFLHKGHVLILPAHSGQRQRCAQGSKTIIGFLSMQTTHSWVSQLSDDETCTNSSSFSELKKIMNNDKIKIFQSQFEKRKKHPKIKWENNLFLKLRINWRSVLKSGDGFFVNSRYSATALRTFFSAIPSRKAVWKKTKIVEVFRSAKNLSFKNKVQENIHTITGSFFISMSMWSGIVIDLITSSTKEGPFNIKRYWHFGFHFACSFHGSSFDFQW